MRKQIKGIDGIISSKKKSVEQGLKEGQTRATLILDKDVLSDLKTYSWFTRSTIKDVTNSAIQLYLQDKKRMAMLKKARSIHC